MPSIAAHLVVGKLVGNKLNKESLGFIQGNVLPDIIKIEDSHCKINGKYYLIPNISASLRKSNIKDNDVLDGYLCHLLLDKYFLDEYIPNNIKEYDKVNLFQENGIYRDYSLINKGLINSFEIDLKKVNNSFKNIDYSYDDIKLSDNLRYLTYDAQGEATRYIDFDDFSKFLIEVSDKIVNDIKKMRRR